MCVGGEWLDSKECRFQTRWLRSARAMLHSTADLSFHPLYSAEAAQGVEKA